MSGLVRTCRLKVSWLKGSSCCPVCKPCALLQIAWGTFPDRLLIDSPCYLLIEGMVNVHDFVGLCASFIHPKTSARSRKTWSVDWMQHDCTPSMGNDLSAEWYASAVILYMRTCRKTLLHTGLAAWQKRLALFKHWRREGNSRLHAIASTCAFANMLGYHSVTTGMASKQMNIHDNIHL